MCILPPWGCACAGPGSGCSGWVCGQVSVLCSSRARGCSLLHHLGLMPAQLQWQLPRRLGLCGTRGSRLLGLARPRASFLFPTVQMAGNCLHSGFPAAPLPAGMGGTPPRCPRLPSRGRCGRCLGSPEGGGGLCGSVPRDELWRPLCAGGCCWVRADSCQAELACPDRAVARGLGGRCLQSAEQERSGPVPAAPWHCGMTRRRPSSASWKLALGFTVAVPSGSRRCREPHSPSVPACCHVTREPDSRAHVHRAPLLWWRQSVLS